MNVTASPLLKSCVSMILTLQLIYILFLAVIALAFLVERWYRYQLQINELTNKLTEYNSYKTKEKNGQIYIRDAICDHKQMDKDGIHPTDDIKKEQDKMKNIVNKHKQNIHEWKKFTEDMNNEYKQCKDVIGDEKNDINVSLLLSSHTNCKSLWQQQQNRMESVSDFISEVASQKFKLKECVTKHKEKVSDVSNNYQQDLCNYNKIREERENLEEELKKKLMKLNECCQHFNISNEKKYKSLNLMHVLKCELKEYGLILTDCPQLVSEYRQFDELNDKNIHEMQQYFEKKWIQSMKKWSEWNAKSIISWIKYLRENGELMLTNDIDLHRILHQMENDKVDGNSLLNMDKADLKTIGFEVLNDRKRVYNKIQKLISKYPHPSIYNDEGKNNEDDTIEHQVKIPKEFLCPISKKIMQNPVKIFDGNTYEKEEIKLYLNQHKKSPSKMMCDEDDIWYQPNRKLKQKIDAFLSVNPQLSFILS